MTKVGRNKQRESADDATEAVTKIVIRRATPYDFVNILRMSELMFAEKEEEVAYPPIDPMKAMLTIVNTKANGEILVADCSRQIVGVLGLLVKDWQWSTERIIVNEFFHVLPNFRSRGTVDALLKAAHGFADKNQLRLVIGFGGGRKAEVKDRMMQMKGYIYAGGTFHRLPEQLAYT